MSACGEAHEEPVVAAVAAAGEALWRLMIAVDGFAATLLTGLRRA